MSTRSAQMGSPGRLEIAKIAIAPAIALFVAIVGWVLTASYNSAQRELATQRAEADVEVARINAAIRYLELARSIPADDSVQRSQAISIAAPVLPPNLAFRLAIDQLPDDPATLDLLLQKYGKGAFAFLARILEVPLGGELQEQFERVPRRRDALSLTKSERRAYSLLRYLRRRGLSGELFDYLISDDYTNERLRSVVLLVYFTEYSDSLGQSYARVRIEEEFRSDLGMASLSANAKQALAFANSVVFGYTQDRLCDLLVREAAERFWVGLDVARGATPAEGSFQAHLYQKTFQENDCRRDAVTTASASLRDTIVGLSLREFGRDHVHELLYAYALSPTVAGDQPYLVPADVVEVMRVILKWASTRERRRELSEILGSVSGYSLFVNMLPGMQSRQATPEEVDANCRAAKEFAVILLDWYEQHHARDWHIPAFVDEIVTEFPDLERRVDRKAWGLGATWPWAANWGCREWNDGRL